MANNELHIPIEEAAVEFRNTSSPRTKTAAGVNSFVEWLKLGVWFPFLVALALWIAFSRILQHTEQPNDSFLKEFNPQNRDDAAYTHNPSTIDFDHMVHFFCLVWCVVVCISEIALPWSVTEKKQQLLFKAMTLTLAFSENFFLTNATTDFIKFRVGALRPDFLIRCFGDDRTELPSKLVNGRFSCPSGKMEKIKDGMVSFPSGHTSVGICMGLFITLYVFWCLYQRVRSTGHIKARLGSWISPLLQQAMFFVALTPVLLGYAVAMTRLTDFRHHFVDILMGIFVGTFFCVLVFARTTKLIKH